MSLTEKEAREKMLRPIGKQVKFKYPGEEGRKEGILKDRAIVWSGHGQQGVKYWDVVDLIEFRGEKHRLWIRIGYYRQIKNRLVWASQFTITEPIAIWQRLILSAAREKPWFGTIIKNAASKLN